MRVYRISKPQYVAMALQGQGSAIAPGRWNSAGVRMAYTASSVSLAMLEILVHINKEDVPAGLRLLSFDVPDDAIFDMPEEMLPAGWERLPPYGDATRNVGDAFCLGAMAGDLAMRVPSAVARGEFNLLINPAHARFGEIALAADEPLALDPRLFA